MRKKNNSKQFSQGSSTLRGAISLTLAHVGILNQEMTKRAQKQIIEYCRRKILNSYVCVILRIPKSIMLTYEKKNVCPISSIENSWIQINCLALKVVEHHSINYVCCCCWSCSAVQIWYSFWHKIAVSFPLALASSYDKHKYKPIRPALVSTATHKQDIFGLKVFWQL